MSRTRMPSDLAARDDPSVEEVEAPGLDGKGRDGDPHSRTPPAGEAGQDGGVTGMCSSIDVCLWLREDWAG